MQLSFWTNKSISYWSLFFLFYINLLFTIPYMYEIWWATLKPMYKIHHLDQIILNVMLWLSLEWSIKLMFNVFILTGTNYNHVARWEIIKCKSNEGVVLPWFNLNWLKCYLYSYTWMWHFDWSLGYEFYISAVWRI